jgi:molybdopterin-containing oxidoreductase family iron-sulfur binding subunit
VKLETKPLDLASIRARLSALRGVEYWRCLEELAESEEFKTLLHQEFPRHATAWMDALDRRSFLKVMGASLALAGLGGCMSPAPAPPDEKIVPYVNQPEEIIPGRPLFFASAMPLSGFGRGVLVESHEGRPTKIEGNPDHPASLGSSDIFMQASALVFYDPDRSRVLTNAGIISTWNRFFAALNAELETQRLTEGAGLRILTETVTSPTLAHQLNTLLKKLPKAKWHQYEPAGRDHVYEGARLAFGEVVDTRYRLDKADVILSIDADFLFLGAGSLRYARDFADKRRVNGPKAEMNRLYVVESTPSVTGSMADHRLPLGPDDIVGFAKLVAKGLGVELPGEAPAVSASYGKWIGALVRDLQKHRGKSLIIAGDPQPPIVHALAHAMNLALGNVGSTVIFTESIAANPTSQNDSLRELVRDMEANAVQVLIMIGGNPVYTAPADLNFGSLLVKSNFSVHLSLYDDETSALCHWHIPETHYLESWSDVRAFDGTASIIQPLIAPLYEGRTVHEVLATIMGQPGRTSYEIVRDYWKQRHPGPDFETFWRKAVHDGVVPGTEALTKQVVLKRDLSSWVAANQERAQQKAGSAEKEKNEVEVLFRLDPTIYDGRFANNGWLQETPKPLTKLTWDNAVLVSPATAERLGLNYRIGTTGGEHGTVYGDVVELEYAGRKVRGTAWILPGQADDCVTLHLGYGRTRAGRVGTKTGFNANSLRTSDAPWHGSGLQIRKSGGQQPLACTQFHHLMEGRGLLRSATLAEYHKNPNFIQASEAEEKSPASLYPGFKYDGYAWGMAIDINSCIGCNACVVACVAENNSPVIGKKEVLRGREMHWIRIDRYYKGGLENPQMVHQPVPCMHCENAPCELVCPVGATNHSHEGLNDMVYNRCVGTRYCSNNCPYKVRRFNFFLYSDFQTPSLKPLRNPDVTVRSRGVMEKCTYCVQRINEAKINAEKENRLVRDGEIVTACQQACPTQAIVFGDVNDPNSRVSKLKAGLLNYTLLDELNTKPRTSYQAKLNNPNPEIEDT